MGNVFKAMSSKKTPENPVIACCVLEGHISVEGVRKHLEGMVKEKDEDGRFVYPELKQYRKQYFCGLISKWKVDPKFDIRNHVKEYHHRSLDDNENAENDDTVIVATQDEVLSAAIELMDIELDSKHSPWQAYLIYLHKDQKKPGGTGQYDKKTLNTVLVIRTHPLTEF